jgi:hypothetical protein
MSLTTTAQIDRVEPPFWYAGMHNPELEILFYGKKHSAIQVTASSSITITNKKNRELIIYLLPSTLKMLLPPKFSFRLKKIILLLHISTA